MVLYKQGTRSGGPYSLGSWVRGGPYSLGIRSAGPKIGPNRIPYDTGSFIGPQLHALCYFGVFRLGELLTPSDSRAQLNWGDITFNHAVQPTMIKVHLSFAKCDQFGRGADIYIGLSGNVICPVAATLAFTAVRGTSAGPFFRTKGGRKSHFIAEVRRALAALSLSSGDYAGHSFRIGAATAAAAAGIQDSTIQTLGRWSSAAFLTYVRTPRQDLATVSAVIARIA